MDRLLYPASYLFPPIFLFYRMNPNIHTRGGYTPLHLSAMHKREKVYQLLLQTYGADPDRRDYSGFKPQHYYLTTSPEKVGEDYLLFDGGEDLPEIVNKMDDNFTEKSSEAGVVPVYAYSSAGSSTNTKVDKSKGSHFLRDLVHRESKRKPPIAPKPGPNSNIP